MGTFGDMLITQIILSKKSLKDLSKLPDFIIDKLQTWILSVERIGLEETRKIPGYHDEPLQGKRSGQRSIRLNRSYRAIYRVVNAKVKFVEVCEVNKHEY